MAYRDWLYPHNWQDIARAVKQANDWRCAACNRQCRRPGEPYRGIANELHVAHITQDYLAPVVQVAPLCLICHFRFDAQHVWLARRRAERVRRHIAGQLDLLR